jgi:purine-binding chemotaxis protein CheW
MPARHVIFRCRGQAFALPLGEVQVVVVPSAFTRVPRAPAAVRGVMNLRGRVVTAIDFAELLALPKGGPVDPALARLLLLEGKLRDLGLLVDEVTGIRELRAEGPAPAGAPVEVSGLARDGEDSVTLLAAERLAEAVRGRFEATR